jgi:hypothetical protein
MQRRSAGPLYLTDDGKQIIYKSEVARRLDLLETSPAAV